MKEGILISVIMPLYNAEQYVHEAFDSVVDQTIGFRQNVELIIIDDGSTDSSIQIARKLEEQYPDNVVIIQQKNSGASAARNKGIDAASGRYIAFLDSDDKWSRNFLKESVRFLKRNPSEGVVASKIKFFDANIGSHHNNYKFTKTRVIDTENEPDNPIFHVSTCVFTKHIIGTTRFEEGLKISEDSKFLLEVIHKIKRYGVVARSAYYYRKRSDKSSTIDGQRLSKDFYLVTPKRVYISLLNLWKDEEGKAARFMQYSILSDLVWRLDQSDSRILSKDEKAEYVGAIKAILSMIDDESILTRRGLTIEKKLFLLRMRHGDIAKSLHVKNGWYCYDNYPLLDLSCVRVSIEFMTPQDDGSIKLEGHIQPAIDELVANIKAITAEGLFSLELAERVQKQVRFFDAEVSQGGVYEFSVVLGRRGKLEFVVEGFDRPLRCATAQFSGFSQLSLSYRILGDTLLRKYRRHMTIRPDSLFRKFLYEGAYLCRLLFYWKLLEGAKKLREIPGKSLEMVDMKRRVFEVAKPFLLIIESIVMLPRMIFLRVTCHLIRLVRGGNPIWIISDRGMAAGDNGEALFRYIMKRAERPVDVYFALSKNSDDYSRLNSIGPTLHYGGLKYKLMFLLADKIISSHADVEVTNPFLRQLNHFVDLFHFDFVFLQHGVTKDDVSSWLNRFEKNIAQFVVAGSPEARSLLAYPYYYTEKNILQSGFPRYDYLEDRSNRKLIIAPTYRADLLKANTDAAGARPYDVNFKKSAYFDFYNQLMNNKRLIGALKQYGMTGELFIHPNFAAQIGDFTENDTVTIADFPYDYKKVFSEGSLLITDYSSVPFDFAYLKKPVIYAQFDKEAFFASHSYKEGYFNYDSDGFGPVVYSQEALIDEILRSIQNDCRMESIYAERVGKFFLHTDKQNSKRVYEAILAS